MRSSLLKNIKPNMDRVFGVRRLHDFYKSPRPEVVIGSNAAIFASLASLQRHPINAHPKLTFICPEFWLDSIHYDYRNLDWGQTILGLPRCGRELLKRIYPNYPDNKLLTWAEFQELRLFAKEELKKHSNLVFIPGLPTITKENSILKIHIENKGDKSLIEIDINAHFYNWARKFAHHAFKGIPQRSHTEIYKRPKDTLPTTLIILGHGESMAWLEQHFPTISFINLKRPHDTIQDNPRYKKESFSRVLVIVEPHYQILPNTSNPLTHATIYDLKSGKKYEGEFFTAIGLRSIPEITALIPKTSKDEIPNSNESWVHPKDLPVGSLLDSYMQWMESTNNLEWAYEPQAYHSKPFALLLSKYMKNNNINVNVDFFNKLDHTIELLPTMVDDNSCFEIFVRSYKEVYNASKAETAKFQDVLRNMFLDKDNIEIYKAKP
jgi:hypothetical protein